MHNTVIKNQSIMELSKEHILEIADTLNCGMLCFYHIQTNTLESHPDPNDPYFDPDPWEELIEKIESDYDNYLRFEKMSSKQAYQVMEDFAQQVNDPLLKEILLDRLTGPKPFARFKDKIDQSDYREKWFEFKSQANIEWVQQQIKDF